MTSLAEQDSTFDMKDQLTAIHACIGQGQISRAAALCEAILAERVDCTGVFPVLALIRLMQNDAPAALSLLRDVAHVYSPTFRSLLQEADAAIESGKQDAAKTILQQAIKLQPYRDEATSLFVAGESEKAKALMAAGQRSAYWYRGDGLERRNGRKRIAVLHALGAGNTPTRYIIDPDLFDFEPICLLQDFDYPIDNINRGFDAVFTAASDPDWDPAAIDLAAKLVERLSLPVINAPSAMQGTMRHLTPDCLKDIAGLHTPKTRQLPRRALLEEAEMPIAGLSFPLLLRPAGSHGGNGLVRVEDETSLLVEAASMTADHVYLTEYYDFASADGLYRKLRVVFVEGKPFPYHLSISDHWLNHYYRTRTAAEEALQAEEGVFLADPEAYLGGPAYNAIKEIGTRHQLDFYGVDGAIDRNGQFVVFECNATMLVKFDFNEGKNEYKRAPAESIRAAVTAAIQKKISSNRSQ